MDSSKTPSGIDAGADSSPSPVARRCPSCREWVPGEAAECPHCGQRLRVWEDVQRPFPKPSRFRIIDPRQGTPLITPYLIGFNLVMYVFEALLSHNFNSFSMAALLRLGVSLPLPAMIATGQYWRWVTANFLHGGLFHIGFNMFALWSIGPLTEQVYGRSKYLSIYLLSGICGFIVSSATGELALGASASIFGLLGMLLMFGRRQHVLGVEGLRRQMWFWLILNLGFDISPMGAGIDWHAHVAGWLAGVALAWLAGTGRSQTANEERWWQRIEFACLALVVVSFGFMAMTGGHYASLLR